MPIDDNTVTVGAWTVSLAGIATALRWIYNAFIGRMDRKEALLDEREKRINAYTDQRIDDLTKDVAALRDELSEWRELSAKQWTAIHMLAARVPPGDPVLGAAEQVLGKQIFSIIDRNPE